MPIHCQPKFLAMLRAAELGQLQDPGVRFYPWPKAYTPVEEGILTKRHGGKDDRGVLMPTLTPEQLAKRIR